MPKFRKFIKYWLPVGLWMALIFSASGDARSYEHSSSLFLPLLHWLFPRMSPEHIDFMHHIFRKCCHLAEYTVLALLLWRAIHNSPKIPAARWKWDEAGLVLSIVFLYAAGDELHQVFVPTRTALTSDVFIDATGGAAGLLFLWAAGKISKRW